MQVIKQASQGFVLALKSRGPTEGLMSSKLVFKKYMSEYTGANVSLFQFSV